MTKKEIFDRAACELTEALLTSDGQPWPLLIYKKLVEVDRLVIMRVIPKRKAKKN